MIKARRLAIVLFMAITTLSIDWGMIFEVMTRRDELRARLPRNADRVPGFAAFLEGVRAHTKNGDTIALIVAAPDPATYGYGFIRSSYVLAGRTVVPMQDERGGFRAAAVREARYLAVFRLRYIGESPVVWRDSNGVLVRQK